MQVSFAGKGESGKTTISATVASEGGSGGNSKAGDDGCPWVVDALQVAR